MKHLSLGGKLIAVSTGFLAMVNIASATSTVQYTYTGETAGGLVMGIKTSDYNGNALVGEFIMTTSNPNFQSTINTYCTDVGAFLSTSFNYTPTALSAANGVSPAWISGGINNVAKLWYNDKGGATTALQTAGLQLAIWELLYNGLGSAGSYTTSTFSNPLNNGFYITSTDANTVLAEQDAAGFLNAFNTLPSAQNVEWLAPTEPDGSTNGSQGLLYQTPGPSTPPSVPETTSTFGLLALAVGALGVSTKKLCKA